MKGVLRLIALVICTMTICKGQSTQTTISPTDSLRRLLPKGYVVFTEAGARLALQNKVNAEAYFKQFTESEKMVKVQGIQIVELKQDNAQLEEDNAKTKKENRQLKFRNTVNVVEIWAYRIIIVLGTGYVIGKK